MKSFKSFLKEERAVASHAADLTPVNIDHDETKGYKPRAKGEQNFANMHKVQLTKYPVASENQFTASNPKDTSKEPQGSQPGEKSPVMQGSSKIKEEKLNLNQTIMELSKKTLGNYIKNATGDLIHKSSKLHRITKPENKLAAKTAITKRQTNVFKAVNRINGVATKKTGPHNTGPMSYKAEEVVLESLPETYLKGLHSSDKTKVVELYNRLGSTAKSRMVSELRAGNIDNIVAFAKKV